MTLSVQFEQRSAEFSSEFEQEQENLSVLFSQTAEDFAGEFGEILKTGSEDIEVYSGSYDVTPVLEGLVLGTENKRMVKDTTIHPIPIFRVSNNSGGTTVVIGG